MGRKGSGFTGQEIEEEEGGFGRVRKSSFLPGTTEQVRHHSKVTRRQTTGQLAARKQVHLTSTFNATSIATTTLMTLGLEQAVVNKHEAAANKQ